MHWGEAAAEDGAVGRTGRRGTAAASFAAAAEELAEQPTEAADVVAAPAVLLMAVVAEQRLRQHLGLHVRPGFDDRQPHVFEGIFDRACLSYQIVEGLAEARVQALAHLD